MHRDGIRIYTGAFTSSPIEALHVEANEAPLQQRKNVLGLRFLYKLKITPTYLDSLVMEKTPSISLYVSKKGETLTTATSNIRAV